MFKGVVIIVLFYALSVFAIKSATLVSGPVVEAPVIQKGKVFYKVNFIFDKCPQDYTIYFDRFQQCIALDFYSTTLIWNESHKSKEFSGELSVKNVETAMSLFGQKGQILFTLQRDWKFEQGWHYESSIVPPTTLQVTFWVELHPALEVKSPKPDESRTDSE